MIEIKNLSKRYRPKKGVPVQALDDISIDLEEKGMVFLLGKSGSGKSTTLNMLGGLDKFDKGDILVYGKSMKSFSQSELDSYRNTFIGFIFQEYNILEEFTVGANIALSMQLQGKKATDEAVNDILKQVDLEGYGGRRPNELSGGQKQRVAIARALIKDPEIIMADEPTGALDSKTGIQVFDTLKKLSATKLVVVVSHDRDFAELYADRIIELADGKIISDVKKYHVEAVKENEGINIVDDRIFQIKEGYQLTPDDLNLINNYIAKSEGDTLLSIDRKANDDFKKLAKINDQGQRDAFKKTEEEDLLIKEYDPSLFQMIKSKLPLKNSFKIGASSLKSKPFKLVMTILLSTVAFTLFGLASTMSTYDKVSTTVKSIEDQNIDYVNIGKNLTVGTGVFSYSNATKLSQTDVDLLNKKFPSANLNPTYSNGDSISLSTSFANDDKFPISYMNFYKKQLLGFSTLSEEQLKEMNYKLTGKLPTKDNEIALSEYMYQHYKVAGYMKPESEEKIEIKSPSDLVGKTIELAGSGLNGTDIYTITGIYDTGFDYSSYKEFMEPASEKETPNLDSATDIMDYLNATKLNSELQSSYAMIGIVAPEAFETMADGNSSMDLYASKYNVTLFGDSDNASSVQISTISTLSDEDLKNVAFLDENKKELEKQDLVISLDAIGELGTSYTEDGDMVTKFSIDDIYSKYEELLVSTTEDTTSNEVKNNLFTQAVVGEVSGFLAAEKKNFRFEMRDMTNGKLEDTENVVIAGVYIPQNSFPGFEETDTTREQNYVQGTIYATNKLISSLGIDPNAKYSHVLGKMPQKTSDIRALVEYTYDDDIDESEYTLSNSVTSTLYQVNTLVETLSNVFFGIGIAFAIFAAIMLMNFISTSISYKKREIGILRAVGARGLDVYGIFFNESLIIAGINWLTSTILTIVGIIYFNYEVRTKLGVPISMLVFTYKQVLLMIAISVGVAAVASFLPVFNIARRKPIDAINDIK